MNEGACCSASSLAGGLVSGHSLTDVEWYLITVLNLHFSDVHISLITCDMEHLFICLFTICISSLLKILASMFMRDIGLYLSFPVGSLFGLGLRIMLA